MLSLALAGIFSGCASSSPAPQWALSPEREYPAAEYLTGKGTGGSRGDFAAAFAPYHGDLADFAGDVKKAVKGKADPWEALAEIRPVANF